MNVIITSHISAHIYIYILYTYILYIYVCAYLDMYLFTVSVWHQANDDDTTPTISNRSFPRELLQ